MCGWWVRDCVGLVNGNPCLRVSVCVSVCLLCEYVRCRRHRRIRPIVYFQQIINIAVYVCEIIARQHQISRSTCAALFVCSRAGLHIRESTKRPQQINITVSTRITWHPTSSTHLSHLRARNDCVCRFKNRSADRRAPWCARQPLSHRGLGSVTAWPTSQRRVNGSPPPFLLISIH